jgi:hypothetical protein
MQAKSKAISKLSEGTTPMNTVKTLESLKKMLFSHHTYCDQSHNDACISSKFGMKQVVIGNS